jgi:hypothetical protein
MIPIKIICIGIYLNLIGRSRYERLMIPMWIIDINIYLDLISLFRYRKLMIPMRFITIDINMKEIHENELHYLFLKYGEE